MWLTDINAASWPSPHRVLRMEFCRVKVRGICMWKEGFFNFASFGPLVEALLAHEMKIFYLEQTRGKWEQYGVLICIQNWLMH